MWAENRLKRKDGEAVSQSEAWPPGQPIKQDELISWHIGRSGFHFSTLVIHSLALWMVRIIYGLMLPVQQLRCIVFLFIFCSYDRL